MKETVSLAARLFIITAVAALLLAVVNGYTSPIIAERESMEYQEALKVAFEEAEEFERIDEGKLNKIKQENDNIDDISIAKKDGKEIGYVAKVIGTGGYGGDIIFVVGVEKEKHSRLRRTYFKRDTRLWFKSWRRTICKLFNGEKNG